MWSPRGTEAWAGRRGRTWSPPHAFRPSLRTRCGLNQRPPDVVPDRRRFVPVPRLLGLQPGSRCRRLLRLPRRVGIAADSVLNLRHLPTKVGAVWELVGDRRHQRATSRLSPQHTLRPAAGVELLSRPSGRLVEPGPAGEVSSSSSHRGGPSAPGVVAGLCTTHVLPPRWMSWLWRSGSPGGPDVLEPRRIRQGASAAEREPVPAPVVPHGRDRSVAMPTGDKMNPSASCSAASSSGSQPTSR